MVFHGFQSHGISIVLKLCSEKITLAYGTVQFVGGVADVTHESGLESLRKSIDLWFSGQKNCMDYGLVRIIAWVLELCKPSAGSPTACSGFADV